MICVGHASTQRPQPVQAARLSRVTPGGRIRSGSHAPRPKSRSRLEIVATAMAHLNAAPAADRAPAVYALKARSDGYRDLVVLAGDAVVECRYQSGYQCKRLTLAELGQPR